MAGVLLSSMKTHIEASQILPFSEEDAKTVDQKKNCLGRNFAQKNINNAKAKYTVQTSKSDVGFAKLKVDVRASHEQM